MADGGVSHDEFKRAFDDLRSLMIQLDQARAEASKMRHETIGNTLMRIINDQSQIRNEINKHIDEDDKTAAEVRTRLTIIEEGQKRMTWVALASMPSAIASWEGLKRFLHW